MTSNQIAYWSLQEDKRHNVTTETETKRHNVAGEAIDLGRLEETRRHNVQTEKLGFATLDETRRHNIVTEGVDIGRLNETIRHNQASEQLGGLNLSLGYSQLAEQIRHNQEQEAISWTGTAADAQLKQSQADLNSVRRTWENILNDQKVDLTTAQINQINSQIDKIQSDIEFNSGRLEDADINNLNNSINLLVKTLEALVPG